MKLIKKVALREVKRAFVIPKLIRSQRDNHRYLGKITPRQYASKLASAKKRVLKFTTAQLDRIIIAGEWKRRVQAFNTSDWYLAEVQITEIGVWKRAGGLPLSWTNGSLKETADKVRHALHTNSRPITKRAGHTIPNILVTNVHDLQNEKYLYPIVFKGGTGTQGRKGLKRKMKGDIDDGCMRSIALAIAGQKTLQVYFGVPKKSRES